MKYKGSDLMFGNAIQGRISVGRMVVWGRGGV